MLAISLRMHGRSATIGIVTNTLGPIAGPACWKAADLEATDWVRALSAAQIADMDRAVRHAKAIDPALDLELMTAADFPLDAMAAVLDVLRTDLIDGVGTLAFTGFPVENYTEHELRAIWWGLGLHLGTAVAQSWKGDVIGDVRDVGTGITGRIGRGYTSNVELGFHCDAADVSGLFFIKQGKTGGVSRACSSVMVHNEMLRRRPDLLSMLYETFHVSWQANEPEGAPPWYDMPVYGRVGDDLACAFVKTNITWAQHNVGAPPLRDGRLEALEMVTAVAGEPGMWVERRFDPGTMWFVNNQTIFHMRTEFTDFDEPDRKRHLFRIFLSLPNCRELPATFASFFGSTEAGAVRGGYPSRNSGRVFSTA
jgi:Taurine catabolism dioxygenase TauD, TfdA family